MYLLGWVECDICGKNWKLNDVSDFSDLYYNALYDGDGCPNCLDEFGKVKQMRLC